MIKVIGGKYRSRNLLTPEEGTLPSKNMVRGAMISALTSLLEDAHCLDLFAGSGALGIEALSRGASYCEFVDASKKASMIVKKNLETLKESNANVSNMDYQAFLKSYEGRTFDIVFLDPPYAMKDSYQISIDLLKSRSLLSKDCAIVLEYEGEIEVDASSFEQVRDYKYGKTKVRLLRGIL